MLSDGLNPIADACTALVSAYGQSGLLDKAFSTVEDMKSIIDCMLDTYTYSILISCCAKFHRFDRAGDIYKHAVVLGVKLEDQDAFERDFFQLKPYYTDVSVF
ncbi:hypothetical protein RIF29_00830 [Crotalaria pallida]|uniref:Pentatricopeptide repeat protein n=1 Tax=Crotalaria pallida TaxID=3830 RepID=A0AAN9IWP1_CROPI